MSNYEIELMLRKEFEAMRDRLAEQGVWVAAISRSDSDHAEIEISAFEMEGA